MDRPIELWEVEVTNTSDKEQDLSLFTYAEWCFGHMDQDLSNFQYILYTCRMGYVEEGIIDYSIRLWPNRRPQAFMASVLPVVSFDTDRETFIGLYRHEGNPEAVEKGICNNTLAQGGNPCAALQNRITLKPGEKKYALFIRGLVMQPPMGRNAAAFMPKGNRSKRNFKMQDYWEQRLSQFTCSTPSAELNTMANIWNQYQCHTTFNWSRSASFNEAGGRDGLRLPGYQPGYFRCGPRHS